MSKLLIVLKLIEDGQIEQQDGSVRVGRLLKELYLDSAVRRADALDKEHNKEKPINMQKTARTFFNTVSDYLLSITVNSMTTRKR